MASWYRTMLRLSPPAGQQVNTGIMPLFYKLHNRRHRKNTISIPYSAEIPAFFRVTNSNTVATLRHNRIIQVENASVQSRRHEHQNN